MMMKDPFEEFKAKQREGWKSYGAAEVHTMQPAAHLVRVAGVAPGQRALDVACGTGPVAITAARAGAVVSGLDLTPELIEHARGNAAVAGVDVAWREGDAEMLPYRDAEFDVVLSQFGHIFAPRPEVAAAELLRVLKPGGTLAVSVWAPEGAVGALFGIIGKHLPPPPGVARPIDWGDVRIARERLGDRVRDLYFERGALLNPALSPAHYRMELETFLAPIRALVHELRNAPERLAAVRAEIEAAVAPFHRDNAIRNDYVIVRGTKA